MRSAIARTRRRPTTPSRNPRWPWANSFRGRRTSARRNRRCEPEGRSEITGREKMNRKWTWARSRASRAVLALALTTGGLAVTPGVAGAQTITSNAEEEIVVTARKRGDENVQDVPIAVSAFSEQTLDALNFHDLASLSYVVPNVSLEDVGTTPGVANFTVRGIGINS